MNVRAKKLLQDVLSAIDAIQTFTNERSVADYQSSDLLRSAVERKFEIIGEALTRLRDADADAFDRIHEAGGIIAFRNRLIHGYDSVDDRIVWEVIHHKLPPLKAEVEGLLGAG